MPRFKHTMFIGLSRHSFTESWYRESTFTNLNDEMAILKQLAPFRARLLGIPCVIYGLRISNVTTPKINALTEYTNYQNDGTFGSAASNVALNMEFNDTTHQHEKLVQLRGIKDDFEVNGGTEGTTWDADYVTRLQQYGAQVVGLQYGWIATTSTTKAPFAYTVLTTGQLSFVFTAPFFTVDQVGKTLAVRVSKCTSSKNLNGSLTVLVTSQTNATSIKPLAAWPQEPGDTAMMQRNVKNFALATGGRVTRLGKRQAGQPSLQSRGRSSVRIRG